MSLTTVVRSTRRGQLSPPPRPAKKHRNEPTALALVLDGIFSQYNDPSTWEQFEIPGSDPPAYRDCWYETPSRELNASDLPELQTMFAKACKYTGYTPALQLKDGIVRADFSKTQPKKKATKARKPRNTSTSAAPVPPATPRSPSQASEASEDAEDSAPVAQMTATASASAPRVQQPSVLDDIDMAEAVQDALEANVPVSEVDANTLDLGNVASTSRHPLPAAKAVTPPSAEPMSCEDDTTDDDIDDDVARTNCASAARRTQFATAYGKEYATYRKEITPAKGERLQPLWAELVAKYPKYRDSPITRFFIVLAAARKAEKNAEKKKALASILQRANKINGIFYCHTSKCVRTAIKTSMAEYVKFKMDAEFGPLVNEGCFGIEEAGKLFELWCHRQRTGASPRRVACCGKHAIPSLESGEVLFNPNSARVCMTCIANRSEASSRVKRAEGTKYSMCKACTKSMNEGEDGAGERFVEQSLIPVVKHHNAMFPDARTQIKLQQKIGSDKPVDLVLITTLQTAEGGLKIYDCIEVNTLGDGNHYPAKDVEKMIESQVMSEEEESLRAIRWWIFPWEKQPMNVEILKRHLLRQLRLTVGVNAVQMPSLQVFLVACSDGTVSEFKRHLQTRILIPETFVQTNVHVYNGCPAPIVPADMECLVRNRDSKEVKAYTMVSLLDRVDPWIMQAGLAKSDKGRTSRKVNKGGVKVDLTPKDLQPKCLPCRLRKGEVCVPRVIDFASMSDAVAFKP